MLTDRFSQALAYARDIHDGQFRKGTQIPYLAHLMSVSALVIEHGGDEDQAIAGLLHDGPEDAGGLERLDDIRFRFGDDVAAIVADCTDSYEDPKPDWKNRKETYIRTLGQKPHRSLLISLADKTHNSESIAADLRIIGQSVFSRFTGGRAGTLWYYSSLADIFSEHLPGALSYRLTRAVHEMSK